MRHFGKVHVVLPVLIAVNSLIWGMAPAQAQIIPLPKATFRESLSRLPGDVGPTLNLYVPESDSYTGTLVEGQHTGTVQGFVQTQGLAGGPALNLFGSAFNQGNPPPGATSFGVGIGATADVEYYFRVLAAPGILSVPIMMPVNFSLHGEREGADITSGEFTVQVRDEFTFALKGATTTSFLLGFSPAKVVDVSGTIPLSFNATNGALGGQYMRVKMQLKGTASMNPSSALVSGNAGATATGSFTGSLDPLPFVDPDFAAANPGITLEFSDNLFGIQSAAPEPGSLALLLLPMTVGVAWFRRAGFNLQTKGTLCA